MISLCQVMADNFLGLLASDIEFEVDSYLLIPVFLYSLILPSTSCNAAMILCRWGLGRMMKERRCPGWTSKREQQHQGMRCSLHF